GARVAQEPAADVDRSIVEIDELDRGFEGRIALGKNLRDEDARRDRAGIRASGRTTRLRARAPRVGIADRRIEIDADERESEAVGTKRPQSAVAEGDRVDGRAGPARKRELLPGVVEAAVEVADDLDVGVTLRESDGIPSDDGVLARREDRESREDEADPIRRSEERRVGKVCRSWWARRRVVRY